MIGLPCATTIVTILARCSVRYAVCSPGSRNAPLLKAIDKSPEIKALQIVDERDAAFVALGIAQVTGNPVALVCTSGSALLNYAPAVAEAYYRSIPLIVVSADRPSEWIDQEDSQTIRQPEALAGIVAKTVNLPVISESSSVPLFVARDVYDAMFVALDNPKAPVHINVQFSNPLPSDRTVPQQIVPVIERYTSENRLSKATISLLAEYLASKRVMLVAGTLPPDSRLNKAVGNFSNLPNVLLCSELMANLHVKHQYFSPDEIVKGIEDKQELWPEVVLSIGGAIVSSKLKTFLRNIPELEVWTLGRKRNVTDTFLHLAKIIDSDIATTLSQLAGAMGKLPKVTYSAGVKATNPSNDKWDEKNILTRIAEKLPPRVNLILSNGMTVRNMHEAFNGTEMTKLPHAVFCNRGVSGIEGSTATAVGSAVVYPGQTVLISGDMSFLYNLGAFRLRKMMPASFRMIVISNGGGGIFRHVATTKDLEQREEYFCMPEESKIPLEELCQTYSIAYHSAEDMQGLEKELATFFTEDGQRLLEIKTPSHKNC